MARMKPKQQLPTLSSWDEVDLALKSIGALQREVTAIESTMNEEIDAAKLKAKEASDPHLAKVAAISRQVQDFAEAHRDDLVNKKTKPLIFGVIGWRKSTKVKLPKDKTRLADIIDLLHRVGWHDCVTQADPTINKEALRLHDFAEVKKLGIDVSIEDVFWLEPARDDLPTKE